MNAVLVILGLLLALLALGAASFFGFALYLSWCVHRVAHREVR